MRSSRLSANLKQIENEVAVKSKAFEDASEKADLHFLSVLRTINNTLAVRRAKIEEDKIRDVLSYLQNIKIKTDNIISSMFLPNEYFSDFLAEKRQPLLLIKNREPSAFVVLNDTHKNFLAQLHSRLIQLIPHWQYLFPLNQNGEVSNVAIAEWQRLQMKVRENATIMDDFARAITIRGEYGDEIISKTGKVKVAVEPNVIKKINNLVSDAKGYSVKDKTKLSQWLIHNGGQDNTRFVDLCFGAGCFSPQGKKFRIGGVEKDSVIQNWDLDGADKICFNYDVFINTLSLEDEPQAGAYIRLDTGLVEFKEDMEEVKEIQKQGKMLPIARVMATVQLDVVNAEVRPKVVKFIFDNYATSKLLLIRPEFVEQTINRENSSGVRMG